MSRVTVYRWTKYDISNDERKVSRRYGTREAVARVGGEVIENSGIEIDQSAVGAEIDGMTARNFDANPRTGFQSQVLTGMRS
ncbi:MAG: hypothetical protein ISS15_21085 [Alphaproteobacteria bacterium]|nr:hypothetical protein [Reyranella sp.]MBL6940074.1 hypothetical protein [Alphaproteobacteria bacterium]MBL7100161.1 hypothetical protein [Alphaproteobacteria bacterium]